MLPRPTTFVPLWLVPHPLWTVNEPQNGSIAIHGADRPTMLSMGTMVLRQHPCVNLEIHDRSNLQPVPYWYYKTTNWSSSHAGRHLHGVSQSAWDREYDCLAYILRHVNLQNQSRMYSLSLWPFPNVWTCLDSLIPYRLSPYHVHVSINIHSSDPQILGLTCHLKQCQCQLVGRHPPYYYLWYYYCWSKLSYPDDHCWDYEGFGIYSDCVETWMRSVAAVFYSDPMIIDTAVLVNQP